MRVFFGDSIVGSFVAFAAIAASCPHTPWASQLAPAAAAGPQVFFDSGAVVRAHLKNGELVAGPLASSLAPGGDQLTIGRDAAAARVVPLNTIHKLKIPYAGTSIGTDVGFRVGFIVALAETDDDDYGWQALGALGGALAGGVIGSRFTRWLTVAEEAGSGGVHWIPAGPTLLPLPPGVSEFRVGCSILGDTLLARELVAVVRSSEMAFHTEIDRTWEVDSATHRIVPVSSNGVRCRNPSWTTPLRLADLREEAAALAFTPSPGKARVYVYEQERWWQARTAQYDIHLDGKPVGRTSHGAYLMFEIDPGPHRVESPGHGERIASFDAAADSIYFVRVWSKRGFWGGVKFGGVALTDETTGRRAILTAQLVRP
jgi:hypothetical protein